MVKSGGGDGLWEGSRMGIEIGSGCVPGALTVLLRLDRVRWRVVGRGRRRRRRDGGGKGRRWCGRSRGRCRGGGRTLWTVLGVFEVDGLRNFFAGMEMMWCLESAL